MTSAYELLSLPPTKACHYGAASVHFHSTSCPSFPVCLKTGCLGADEVPHAMFPLPRWELVAGPLFRAAQVRTTIQHPDGPT